MQAARIWFRNTTPPVTLADIEAMLTAMGAVVTPAQWQMGDIIVPQLQVSHPAHFLTQIETADYVPVEAQECADDASPDIAEHLRACDARLVFGDSADDTLVASDQGLVAFTGWTTFDPANPAARALLEGLTRRLNGVFNDNVNGGYWKPD